MLGFTALCRERSPICPGMWNRVNMRNFDTCPIVYNGVSAIVSYPNQSRRRNTGVLLCRSWAHAELCSRKFYKVMADRVAEAGFPTLRFDYPGTVDSCDPAPDNGLESWVTAADGGADVLKDLGCNTIVVFGFCFGAVVAHALIQRRNDVSGAIFAAPVVNGRRFIREINIREKVLFETERIPLERLDTSRTSLLGNVMPEQLVKDVSAVRLDAVQALADTPVLSFNRDNTKSDQDFSEKLKSVSGQVTVCDFHEYTDLTEDVLTSKVPKDLVDTAVTWLENTQANAQDQESFIDPKRYPPTLVTDSFVETTEYVEFSGKRLLTIVTKPVDCDKQIPVYLLGNTGGYDHRGGLGRESVEAARKLALAGVASVRFDDENTGDSYPDLPEGQEILYSDASIQNLERIIDFACRKFEGPLTLVGRCSSAYAAFHAAARDERVNQLVLVNQLKFIWDKDIPNELKNMMTRSAGEYKKRLADPQIVRRILRGDVNLVAAALGVSRVVQKRLSEKTADYIPRLSKFGRLRLEALDLFKTLNDRNVPVHFLCSIGDGSIEELKAHFGPDLRRMSAYPNITYTTVKDADHRLMPVHGRNAFIDLLVQTSEMRPGISRPNSHPGNTRQASTGGDALPTV